MKIIFTFLFSPFFINLVNAQEVDKIDTNNKMNWLVGSWKGMHNGTPFYEAWRKVNDNILANFNIEIKGKDTLVKESGAIVIKDGKAAYINEPNQWTVVRINDKEIVLEMPAPKFHNRIIWMHTSDGHWLTLIQQQKSTLHYNIVRMPELEGVVDRFIASAKK